MKTLIAAAALALLAGGANAAAKVSEAQARYNEERAVCMNGTSNQDRATCLKEAGAAFAEAKRDNLGTSGDSTRRANRTARCDAQPVADREDCLLRMKHGAASGSSQQGGILRETTTTVTKP
jgi:hypothetical protein